jgi:hypothetical protein
MHEQRLKLLRLLDGEPGALHPQAAAGWLLDMGGQDLQAAQQRWQAQAEEQQLEAEQVQLEKQRLKKGIVQRWVLPPWSDGRVCCCLRP